MHGEEKFCPDCGAPTVVNEQSVAPQPQQEAQNNVPMQPYASNFPQGAGNQSGQQVRTAGNNKKLYYGLGIVAGVLILLAGALVADYFWWQRQMEEMQQDIVVNMTEEEMKAQGIVLRKKYAKQENGQAQSSSSGTSGQAQSSSAGTPAQTGNAPVANDPIRANSSAGLMSVASRMDDRYVEKALQIMQGDWYDDKGAKAMTISNRRINGCEVVGLFDMAGGGGRAAGTFRLREKGKEWDVRLSWDIKKGPGDTITINGKQTFHKK